MALFMSSAHKVSTISLSTQTSFQSIGGELECDQSYLIILSTNRPPGRTTTFFSELQDIMSHISTLSHDLNLMGELQSSTDSSLSVARQLSDILETFDVHQYLDFPTHINSHSLDLMISSSRFNVLSVSTSELISDHCSVVADLKIQCNDCRTIRPTNYQVPKFTIDQH